MASPTSTGLKGLHVNDNSSSETERTVVTASGELHQIGTKITSTAAELNLLDGQTYKPIAFGTNASPTYKSYGTSYKLAYMAATYKSASKAFLFSDLKTIVFGTATTMVQGASLAAGKPGMPTSYAAYYTAKSTTTAGATLRLHGMFGSAAATAHLAYRIRIMALGTI